MRNLKTEKIAIWAITSNGVRLAEKITAGLPEVDLFASERLGPSISHTPFERLAPAVREHFGGYAGHVFITATGIAVRMIAPLLVDKTRDSAVVVLDEQGRHAISLVSGHIGGANALTVEIAKITGARPVITTATDVSGVPAIDLVAVENGLTIENPAAIKTINMAFIRGEEILLHDPAGILGRAPLPDRVKRTTADSGSWTGPDGCPGVYVDDAVAILPEEVLVLRPQTLAAGIGCNRNTGKEEIGALLAATLAQHRLALGSIKALASINIKNDEPGLLALAAELDIPLVFYTKEELNRAAGVVNPSPMVETHTGAKNVCEAAAILATGQGSLVVPKKKSKNATVAIARAVSI